MVNPTLITSLMWSLHAISVLHRLMVFTLLCIFGHSVAHAQGSALSAFVDRNDISGNDIITLTIRVGSTLGTEPPNLNGLNQNFDRLGTTVSDSYTSINGQVEEWREYRITLRPKTTGELEIPAFRKGNATTLPITITVGDAQQMDGASSRDIFLSTTLSKDSVYVQEQLVYTIKLYYSVRFDQGAQLSNPRIDNAFIQQLGADQNYQEIVEGIRYDVTERKFVIFPQASGQLEIPPIYFTASIGGRSGISRLLSRNTPARQINLVSEAYTIAVRGIPASFDGSTWLPASSLDLEETWSGDVDALTLGESVTRNLQLTAMGLSSSLLPAMEYEEVDGLRFYPDQPNRQDSADSSGVIGIRSEGAAIVASAPGAFTLPEIRIPWWNVNEDRMEFASLPARTIGVTGSLLEGIQPAPQLPEPAVSVAGASNTPGESTATSNSLLWIGVSIAFALAWLASTFLWLRSRQALADHRAMGPVAHTALSPARKNDLDRLPKPENSLRYLQQACDSGDLPNARRWVISWGQAFYRNRDIKTLDQLQSISQSEALSQQLGILERLLYGAGEECSDFDAKVLLREVIAINRRGLPDEQAAGKNALPPLYQN